MTILRNTLDKSSAVLASLYSTIYAYLVNLSVITRIESYFCPVYSSLDSSSLTTKSIAIDSYSLRGVLGNFICLYKACLAALFYI